MHFFRSSVEGTDLLALKAVGRLVVFSFVYQASYLDQTDSPVHVDEECPVAAFLELILYRRKKNLNSRSNALHCFFKCPCKSYNEDVMKTTSQKCLFAKSIVGCVTPYCISSFFLI